MSSNDLRERLIAARDNAESNVKDNVKDEDSFNFNFNIEDDSKVRYVPLNSLQEAPREWNFYKPLNDDKMTELIESIEKNGLLNPIIIWERDNDPTNPIYMILSGHNRKRAFELLGKVTGNENYNKIPALIKGLNEITEKEAREIIIDTNWVQRQLSPMEKARSIIEKYTVLQEKSIYRSAYSEYGEGRLRDIVAEQYEISGRQVENYRSLENLILEIQELVSNGEVSITSAYEVARLDKELQYWIYENHINKLTTKYTRKLKVDMTSDEVKGVFEKDYKENIMIKINIPAKTHEKYNTLSTKDKIEIKKKIIELIEQY